MTLTVRAARGQGALQSEDDDKCAADSVSYEATRFGQGLLTYSLLQGMRGARLRDGEYLDVAGLFGDSADRVPELARDIGGAQRPTIASPHGVSFDIGRLTKANQARVPLKQVMPMVVRSVFQLEKPSVDRLGLSLLVDGRLRDVSARREGPKLVFNDTAEFACAVLPSGRYRIDGNKVTGREDRRRDRKAADRGESAAIIPVSADARGGERGLWDFLSAKPPPPVVLEASDGPVAFRRSPPRKKTILAGFW